MDINERLKVFDDELFLFDEEKHIYSYNNKKLTSVTKFVSSFHKPFDTKEVSRKVAEETGREQSSIIEEWEAKNKKSIKIGHNTHSYIENYYNKKYQELPTDLDTILRINSFNIAWTKYLYKLTPIAFEKRVFNTKLGIAGTMDALFYYNDKVIILDYKSNEEFRDDDHPKGRYNKLFYPFQEFYQNHLNEYSIQVSLYSLILKEVAGIDVDKCLLLHIGNNGPKMYVAHDFRDRLSDWFRTK